MRFVENSQNAIRRNGPLYGLYSAAKLLETSAGGATTLTKAALGDVALSTVLTVCPGMGGALGVNTGFVAQDVSAIRQRAKKIRFIERLPAYGRNGLVRFSGAMKNYLLTRRFASPRLCATVAVYQERLLVKRLCELLDDSLLPTRFAPDRRAGFLFPVKTVSGPSIRDTASRRHWQQWQGRSNRPCVKQFGEVLFTEAGQLTLVAGLQRAIADGGIVQRGVETAYAYRVYAGVFKQVKVTPDRGGSFSTDNPFYPE